MKEGLLERVQAEGKKSPADVLMTVDIGNLIDLTENGVTQPIHSKTLNQVIPAHLRAKDGSWYTLSLRDRVLYVEKDLPTTKFFYEDLADPQWKGKICIRSGQHPYNTALVASMIAHNGEAATETWLKGVKANLARKPTGSDRDVARDILGGICDIGIANTYYVGRMKNAAVGSQARQWGDAVKVIRPTFKSDPNSGTQVNISGASIAKYAPNKKNGIRLLEFLVSPMAQAMYAKVNYEYPVRQGVKLDPVVASFGKLKIDPLPLTAIAENRKRASQLIDKVNFDQ